MKNKGYESELPEGYRQVLHFNAKDLSFGILLNLIALAITAAVGAIAFLVIDEWRIGFFEKLGLLAAPIACLAICFSLFLYLVLHELTHGVGYKLTTGQKLTYGFTLTVAFCGVPSIYVTRRTALISASLPLIIYSVLFILLAVVLYPVNTILYLLTALLFAIHFGGCIGDMILIFLLLFKYRDRGTLVRDTGPEQFIFLPPSRD